MTSQVFKRVSGNDLVRVEITNQKGDIHFDIKNLNNRILKNLFVRRSFRKSRNLINAYKSRREYAELITSRAVERCQEKMEAQLISLNINSFNIEEIYSESELILREELFKRFKMDLPVHLERVDYDFSELFRLVAQYRKTKKRTLFITGLAEEWNREAWGRVIPEFITNPSVSWTVSHLDLNLVVLKGLGISTEKEKREYQEQLMRRVNGAQMAIRIGISQNIRRQVAKIFYEIHDQVIDAKLADKLNELTGKRAVCTGCQGKAINT